jgi:hypothetical protein
MWPDGRIHPFRGDKGLTRVNGFRPPLVVRSKQMRKTMARASHKQDLIAAALLAALATASADARAQESEAELAKAAQNPVAAMISVPMQYNYNQKIGPLEDGDKSDLFIQPVIPFSLNHDWNLISRTIIPVTWQSDIVPGAGSQSGIGDITASLFFSPKKPTSSGWIWGVGPVFYLPSASNDLLGADKWGAGPTAVFLKQEHGFTYGALMNHIWSVGGSGKADISNTYLQPFFSYTTKTHTTFAVNTESSYNWETENWLVPINLLVKQVLKLGDQPIQLTAGARYWADSPDNIGPQGWGARFEVTFLFPK